MTQAVMSPQPELLLITGIPGTGKTWYGDKFAEGFGFAHYNLEDTPTFERFKSNVAQFISDIANGETNAVVSWGFAPDNQPSVLAVLQFRSAGFKWIWFDGNRETALRTFEKRTRAKEKSDAGFYFRMYEFYLQMYRVEATQIIEQLKPTVINPFDNNGQFKPAADLLDEIRKSK